MRVRVRVRARVLRVRVRVRVRVRARVLRVAGRLARELQVCSLVDEVDRLQQLQPATGHGEASGRVREAFTPTPPPTPTPSPPAAVHHKLTLTLTLTLTPTPTPTPTPSPPAAVHGEASGGVALPRGEELVERLLELQDG